MRVVIFLVLLTACEKRPTRWDGVPAGQSVRCREAARDTDVFTCVATPARQVLTCVRTEERAKENGEDVVFNLFSCAPAASTQTILPEAR